VQSELLHGLRKVKHKPPLEAALSWQHCGLADPQALSNPRMLIEVNIPSMAKLHDAATKRKPPVPEPPFDIAQRCLHLSNHNNVFERLGRHESALWR
jgi:hypothetical protein